MRKVRGPDVSDGMGQVIQVVRSHWKQPLILGHVFTHRAPKRSTNLQKCQGNDFCFCFDVGEDP